MKLIKIIFLLLFPILCFGQLDTVKVYDGLEISYMTRKDTALMSVRKWNSIVDIMKSQNKILNDCNILSDKYKQSLNAADKQIEEYKLINQNLNERTIIYQGSYEFCTEKLKEVNTLWQHEVKQVEKERRRGVFTGTTYGIIGGFVVGVITTAIILK